MQINGTDQLDLRVGGANFLSASGVDATFKGDVTLGDGTADRVLTINGLDAGAPKVAFGSPSDALGAQVGWNYSTSSMFIQTDKAGGSLVFRSDTGVTALTLDSSQNATFASRVAATGFSDSVSDANYLDIEGGVSTSGSCSLQAAGTDANVALFFRNKGTANSGFRFYHNTSTEIARIDTDGIKFNGDTAAANGLDDYEEGSHTATVSCSTSGTVTLNSLYDTLAYTKIGRYIHVQGELVVSSVSSPTGYLTVSLPVASLSPGKRQGRSVASIAVGDVSGSNIESFVGFLVEGESSLRIYLGDNPSYQADSAQAIVASSFINISLSYLAA